MFPSQLKNELLKNTCLYLGAKNLLTNVEYIVSVDKFLDSHDGVILK